LDKIARMIKSSRDPWGDKDSLEKTRKRQERIEEKIRKHSWGETVAEHDMFIKTIHQFFSPRTVPDGLTEGEARLLYLLAKSINLAVPYLSKEFTNPKTGKVTRKFFQKGLREFQSRVLLANGKIREDGSVKIWED
jgi:hypothetical protein